MTMYVMGLCFCKAKPEVLLMRKSPECKVERLRGKLNGIGGAAGDDENLLQAMVREFGEETGMHIPARLWDEFCEVIFAGGDRMRVYRAHIDPDKFPTPVAQKVDEPVMWYKIDDIFEQEHNDATHLLWLLPMALEGAVYCGKVEERPE